MKPCADTHQLAKMQSCLYFGDPCRWIVLCGSYTHVEHHANSYTALRQRHQCHHASIKCPLLVLQYSILLNCSVRQVVAVLHELLSICCIQLQLIELGVVDAILLAVQLCMSADTASDGQHCCRHMLYLPRGRQHGNKLAKICKTSFTAAD